MKVLVLDFWFGQTHRRTNIHTLKILSDIGDVVATNFQDYYDVYRNNDKFELINVKCHNKKTSKFWQRFRSMYNIWQTWKAIRDRDDYDAVLVTGYEVISVALFSILYKQRIPIFLQYHQHIDQVDKPIKRIFFDFYKNRMHHVLLEEQFAEYFASVSGVSEERIHVVHHMMLGSVEKKLSQSRFVLGIGGSNDERIVKKIIDEEKDTKSLFINGITVRLRSNQYHFKDENLQVDHDFLDAKDYKKLFDEAGVVLVIPRKEEYEHRVSGSIYDALSSGKKVIGVELRIMKIMNHYAPSMYYILRENEDLMEVIKKCLNEKIDKNDLVRIRRRHSDEALASDYREMFRRVLGDKFI